MHDNAKKNWIFPLILLSSLITGGFTGHYFSKEYIQYLKPLGEIFLNLIFTIIIPLIFFSITSAITKSGSFGKLGKLFFYMVIVFVITGLIATLGALLVVSIFPPAGNMQLPVLLNKEPLVSTSFSQQIVNIFTVPDFAGLLTHDHMLPLMIFSILVGLSIVKTREKTQMFADFFQAGEVVFMQVFSFILYLAPIGFFAWFAVLVNELGTELMENYLRIFVIYTVFAAIYFITVYTAYAFFAGGLKGARLFWKNMIIPALLGISTCSSAATIPANMAATKAMGVSPEIAETMVPLGSLIHKEGSVIGGMFKIAFLFGLFHWDFNTFSVLLPALGVSLLVGTVMGAIPSGGMLGELLILNFYGFPPAALMTIAAISIIIDPMATLLNVTGNSASSLLVQRLMNKP